MNKEQELIIEIFKAISKAITLVNGLVLIMDKYHPKTIEELIEAIDKEKYSKTD